MLQRSKHLRSINVGNGALGPAGLAALAAGLAANTSLHTLFLEGKGKWGVGERGIPSSHYCMYSED